MTDAPSVTNAPALTIDVRDTVAIVTLDVHGSPVNTLTRAVRDEADYPGTDLYVRKDENGIRYTRKSGEPYS